MITFFHAYTVMRWLGLGRRKSLKLAGRLVKEMSP